MVTTHEPVMAEKKVLTIDQKRSLHAWKAAREGIARFNKDYANTAKGLPALIMNSGLLQVIAFLQGKGDHYKLLAEQIREWLNKRFGTPTAFEDFMENILKKDSQTFQMIHSEALAWLKWLRYVATAQLKISEHNEHAGRD